MFSGFAFFKGGESDQEAQGTATTGEIPLQHGIAYGYDVILH